MSLAIVASRAVAGLDAPPVRVEVHLAPGLPLFTIVGLPDTGVRESRERVRAALVNSGYVFPPGRVTVNLAPADLHKESGRFDLPIAIGILLASGQLVEHPDRRIEHFVLAGELSLTGALSPVAAALPIALAVARSQPAAILILPAGCAAQGSRVPGLTVLAAPDLAAVTAHLSGGLNLPQAQMMSCRSGMPDQPAWPCLSDVRGQPAARRALEVAAAGGHHLLLSGAPGSGKSMLAQRLPGILPRLSAEEALEVAAIACLQGDERAAWDACRPFRAPHHGTTPVAMAGGGAGPRPGEVSLAHRGVLFLDELPEFRREVLEMLREPLETGTIQIARSRAKVSYPAAFQLVAAMNPCPCGGGLHCLCTPEQRQRYRSRISGPLLDRFDLLQAMPPQDAEWLALPAGEASRCVAERVLSCRNRQTARQGCSNAMLSAGRIESLCPLQASAQSMLRQAMQRWRWSARAVHRVLRVARTVADLEGRSQIDDTHLAEAIRYRRPLASADAIGS
ncbi:YifB family Mg chelatase-like AAA ATPase [Corticimicrobacter populi]|uniref:ATP-dependent protease n=1 Tax=Corticimicrobacter populi TaxID=2175229 RepID=A0A2V1JX41_9BURK|nr:YifB family Mg chelatase-like AAA ATPase [Corticimicrobacter populi]PWF23042.1 ATP-dependent protease [Corticimicrobacter populi]